MDELDPAADEPSENTTILPPQITTLLRRALYTDLQRTSEDAPTAGPGSYTRAAWIPVLTRMNATARALDAIDWKEPNEQKFVLITLDTTMIGALEAEADHWTWLSEAARTESARGPRTRGAARLGDREVPGRARRAARAVIIPTAAFPVIRECATKPYPSWPKTSTESKWTFGIAPDA